MFSLHTFSTRGFYKNTCYRLRAHAGCTGRFVVGRGRGWSNGCGLHIPMKFFRESPKPHDQKRVYSKSKAQVHATNVDPCFRGPSHQPTRVDAEHLSLQAPLGPLVALKAVNWPYPSRRKSELYSTTPRYAVPTEGTCRACSMVSTTALGVIPL